MLSHPRASSSRLGISRTGPFNCNHRETLVQTQFSKDEKFFASPSYIRRFRNKQVPGSLKAMELRPDSPREHLPLTG